MHNNFIRKVNEKARLFFYQEHCSIAAFAHPKTSSYVATVGAGEKRRRLLFLISVAAVVIWTT